MFSEAQEPPRRVNTPWAPLAKLYATGVGRFYQFYRPEALESKKSKWKIRDDNFGQSKLSLWLKVNCFVIHCSKDSQDSIDGQAVPMMMSWGDEEQPAWARTLAFRR